MAKYIRKVLAIETLRQANVALNAAAVTILPENADLMLRWPDESKEDDAQE